MRKGLIIAVVTLPLLSGGCVAKTAFDVVTAPVKVVGKAADWATTSQDEADRNYGRKMREKEEEEGREAKKRAEKRAEKCRKDPDECD